MKLKHERAAAMHDDRITALGRMTYGIYVLTVKWEETVNGMIASWVTQVSFQPPLILTAVHPNRFSHGLIEKSRSFALHVLDTSQKDMLRRFKGPDPAEKFSGLSWKSGKTGSPILTDCLAWFDLRVREQAAPGNHTLFTGEVIDCGYRGDGTPLCTLDYKGMYKGDA